ncbi:ferric reductase transmembrane component 4 [Verticillium alfalfae VaMs.102]|uniref:Ferric reductase transmembrane component 4 n=1 Tax=Verticillium alfalfae (strain VaMs.102 / ATCC MYA-4576 / FGSC 10136) TaxID=526221 RepID=C9SLH2_VERA1|nr:ferric reductase transmembrane component 4 [Verticillium alfalfae VaMs.102]EEY19540.1 ferric reductase transmembrane component 4 [Verticillium alfalfae VaMs.102]
MYKPPCAFACNGAISNNALSCSSMTEMEGMDSMPMTTPECRANDTSFLTTLAWCLQSNCAEFDVPVSELQKFWEEQATGEPTVQPKWSYSAGLQSVQEAPTKILTMHDTLNFTALTSEEDWDVQFKTLSYFEREEAIHARYGITHKVAPYIVWQSLIGTYRVRPLPYLIGTAPSIGHASYIALMIILNVILTAVNYKSAQPNAWFSSQYQEILEYVMIRTGTLGFALSPLVILFAGRNNVLLWLSNWSHSTFMLLHRWIARIFGLQVIIHSITALALYSNIGTYSEELKLPYWIWGCVASVAVVIMLVASNLYVRRQSYEVFLVIHILLAVFVIAGCWYHVDIRFQRKFGYEMWLYASCAVWFFDRMMRMLRVLKNGMRRSNVVNIDEDVVRVDVPGIRWAASPGQHVYVYFPTLNRLRPWENHPFSVIPTTMLYEKARSSEASASPTRSSNDVEKNERADVRISPVTDRENAGLTLFIRKSAGLTKALTTKDNVLTLLDGPYSNNSTAPVLQCDRLLLIGGGIGITALVPWIDRHPNVKLSWSVKDSAKGLVRALENAIDRVEEKDVRVGSRLDFNALLDQEVQLGWSRIGVVVSGPGGLCDDAAAAVIAAGKRGKALFELEIDAYSW